MTPSPPRAAIWLIEFFVPPATAEPAVGDLAEEFAARASQSESKAFPAFVLAGGILRRIRQMRAARIATS